MTVILIDETLSYFFSLPERHVTARLLRTGRGNNRIEDKRRNAKTSLTPSSSAEAWWSYKFRHWTKPRCVFIDHRMTIAALIVDDEAPARDELAYLLAEHEDVAAREAGTAANALDMLAGESFDVVFQDIQMPGMSGFEVMKRAFELDAPPLFVFVTAYDEYAVKAFEAEALDYLLKPVSEERLAACLDRVRQRLAARAEEALGDHQAFKRLLSTIEGTSRSGAGNKGNKRLPVERHGRIRLTPMQDLLLFEVEGKRVLARIAGDEGGERHPLHGVNSLACLEERLDAGRFFRISRSAVVNLERIAEVAPYRDGKYIIILDDPEHTEITVGRARAGELKERLGLA